MEEALIVMLLVYSRLCHGVDNTLPMCAPILCLAACHRATHAEAQPNRC